MIADGMIASDVSVIPEKGCAFKVLVEDLGDVIDVFIPLAEVNGHSEMKIGQKVVVNIRKPYISQGGIKFKVLSCKPSLDHKK